MTCCEQLTGEYLTHIQSVPTYGNRNDENKVYNHVNRLGHHFPNDVVDKGYDALHLAPEKTRYAQDARGRWRDTDDAVISRERLFNQIRNCLYEIYPHIPEWNANQILDRAMVSIHFSVIVLYTP